MATDVEECDKISPKKQRTLLTQTIDYNKATISSLDDYKEAGTSSNFQSNYDEEKRRKLREWQAWQVRKASEDNAINEMTIPAYSINPYYDIMNELDNMVDQAVSMAIQRHGLVCSTSFTQSQPLLDNVLYDMQCNLSNKERNLYQFLLNSCISDNVESLEEENEDVPVKDKMYDNDQQQDFLLEQAVAEAIKKKGLSALTVDYG